MLYVYPMDTSGCGSYRIRWPAMQLKEQGHDITILHPGDDGGLKANLDDNRHVMGVEIPDDCTGVLLQRPSNEVLVETIPFLKEQGIRVIVDVDDDLSAVSPRHALWKVFHTKSDSGQSWAAVVKACQQADMVVASTPAIAARYASHGRGAVVRNRLPDHFFDVELPGPIDEAVGWAGDILSHPDDLAVVGNSLAQIRCGVKIVGPVPIDITTKPPFEKDWKRGPRLLGTDKIIYTGSVAFEQWIPAISEIFVGMAPLETSTFNVAKSYLKPLEYSVAKVPFVCSDTPEYLHLGAGLSASRPKDWMRGLKSLLNSESARNEEIERNYEIAQKNRISLHLDEWEDAWFG